MFENLKNCLDNFSAEYEKPIVRYLNCVYMVVYGIIYVNNINKKVKYVWICYTLLSQIICMSSILAYCFTQKQILFEEYVQSVTMITGSVLAIATQLSFVRFSKEVRELFRIMDEEFDLDFMEIAREVPMRRATNKLHVSLSLKFLFSTHILCMILILGNVFRVILAEKINFHSINVYIFPAPGLAKVSSPELYVAIYMAQYVVSLIMPFSLVVNSLFFDLLVAEIVDEFEILREIIAANSKILKNKLKYAYRVNLKKQENIKNRKLLQRFERMNGESKLQIFRNFHYRCILFIRCHQKLMRLVRIYDYFHRCLYKLRKLGDLQESGSMHAVLGIYLFLFFEHCVLCNYFIWVLGEQGKVLLHFVNKEIQILFSPKIWLYRPQIYLDYRNPTWEYFVLSLFLFSTCIILEINFRKR